MRNLQEKKPIRVLHFILSLDMGGVQLMLMNYYRNIDKNLVQFDFVVQGKKEGFFEEEVKSYGGKIFRVTSLKENFFKYNKEVRELLIKEPYQVVHIHHNFANIHAATQAKRAKVKYIISHSHAAYPEKSFYKKIIKSLIRYRLNKIANYKFACSKKAGQWLYGERQITKDKVMIMNNAINVNDFSFSNKKREEIRKRLDLDDFFVIGHVGSFTKSKNHEFLLNIFQSIHKKNKKTKLVLIGEGEFKNEIKDSAKEKGLEENILFLGKRTNVNEIMFAFDIFLFPSIYEGLGIVLIEAQASGLICFVSKEVPQEVKVTDLIHWISLNETADDWAYKIGAHSKEMVRKNEIDNLRKSGYDIKLQAKLFESFYLDLK